LASSDDKVIKDESSDIDELRNKMNYLLIGGLGVKERQLSFEDEKE